MKSWIIIAVLFVVETIGLSSCKATQSSSDKKCPDSVQVTLVDMTGLDGCKWLLELSNGDKLEPINLNDFDIELVNKKQLQVQYHPADAMGSICMAGEIVVIDCLAE